MQLNSSVESFLRSLGLEKYIDVFRENEVDMAAAHYLSDDDLKDLGLPLGPRRKFSAAIGQLAVPNLATIDPDKGAKSRGSRAGAERRQLTVMFCDLVDSTALSRQVDPEDLRDLMRQYQDIVAGAITRYGGHVAKFLGDGVLAYFGWPQAFEDQAERAVRAGIDAVNAIGAVKSSFGKQLASRVGIATGQVVVGDLIGEVAEDAEAVLGETPNLAARLQDVAQPGQVVIGEITQRLLGATFELSELGCQTLKGFDTPVPVWSVIREGVSESRFDAARGSNFGEIIGREHELAQIADRWYSAIRGRGQVVLITAEAGLGKSRLIRALSDQIATEKHFRLSYQCSPHHTNSAFYPIVHRLARAAGFDDPDTDDEKLDKLETLLLLAENDISVVAPVVARLMGIPCEDRYGALNLEPPQLRTRTIDALVTQVLQLCEKRPVLMIVEDAHWIDPTTEALIGELIASIVDANVLVAITQRPEYHSPWLGHPHLTSLTLNRLDNRQGEQIARRFASDEISEEVLSRVVEKSGGVPLFIEELTKSIVEADLTIDSGGDISIPDTLQASLISRLDHLGDAKDIAQVASVIGREFPYWLVERLSGRTSQDTERLLEKLVQSELAFQRGLPPYSSYTFKHALIQDTAYDSLLISRRRDLHARTVAAIEGNEDGRHEDSVETLAYHAERGELWGKTLRYSRLAGLRANDRSAYREAVRFMDAGIAAASHLDDAREVTEQVIDIHMNMRPSLGSFGQYERLLESLSEANRLATSIGDDPTATFADVVKTHVLYQSGHVQEVLAIGERAVGTARSISDRRIVIAATANLGMGYCFSGDFKRAVQIASEFEHELKTTYRHENLGTTGTSSVNWLSNLSGMNTNLGRFEKAESYCTEAKAISEETGKPFDSAMFGQWYSHLLISKGEPERAVEVLDASEDTLREYDIDFLRTWMDSWLGAACALAGDFDRAESVLLSAVSLAEKNGLHLSGIWSLTRLASLYLDKGDIASGSDYAVRALDHAKKAGAGWFEVPALQCMARAAARTDSTGIVQAQNFWTQSIEMAEAIDARPDLAHSRRGLGEMFATTDRPEDAKRELTAAVDLYKDLGMTFWLPKTEELLASVNR